MAYGSIKKYTYEDMNENGEVVKKTITLEFNPLTLIKYHNYVGRDLLADLADIAKSAGKANVTGESGVTEMTDADFDALVGLSASLEFFSNLIAAMICTARRHERLDFEEVIASIPMDMFSDGQFMSEVMELITFGLKKK